jgi:hypothetical protein
MRYTASSSFFGPYGCTLFRESKAVYETIEGCREFAAAAPVRA